MQLLDLVFFSLVIPKNCQMFYKFIDDSTKTFREILLIIRHFSAKSITQLQCKSTFLNFLKKSNKYLQKCLFLTSFPMRTVGLVKICH